MVRRSTSYSLKKQLLALVFLSTNLVTTGILVIFYQLTQSRVTWENRMSVKELPPTDWPVGKSIGHFLG